MSQEICFAARISFLRQLFLQPCNRMSFAEPQHDGHTAAMPANSPPPIDWPAALAEHGRWLRTVVIARLGEPQAADEVMQELALAVLRQSAPLADRAKLAPWLYRLAVTQALLYRRQHGRRRKLTDRYANRFRPTEEDARGDALSWLLADERRQLIREALARLSSRDAEILLLKYTHDWSYRELAEHLGVSHSARRGPTSPGATPPAVRVVGPGRDRGGNMTERFEFPLSIDSQFDRLVDGELSDAEVRPS